MEVWKSQNSVTHNTKWITRNEAIQNRRTRASNENKLKENN